MKENKPTLNPKSEIYTYESSLEEYEPGQWWLDELASHWGNGKVDDETRRAALSATATEGKNGWKGIKDAPRDGTVILLRGGAYHGAPFSGKWDLGPFEDTDRPWLNVITNSRLYEHVPTMWMEI